MAKKNYGEARARIILGTEKEVERLLSEKRENEKELRRAYKNYQAALKVRTRAKKRVLPVLITVLLVAAAAVAVYIFREPIFDFFKSLFSK